MLRKGKGKEARLAFMAHALLENRHGMLVDFQTTQATGTAERDIVPELLGQAGERGFGPGVGFLHLSGGECYPNHSACRQRDRFSRPHLATGSVPLRRSSLRGMPTAVPVRGRGTGHRPGPYSRVKPLASTGSGG